MKLVSLFAGIGGFDLGFERAGFETVAAVEIDPNCRKILGAKFPKAALFDDVAKVGSRNLPACDVVCGGFPCQDLSVAGARAGLAGARSGLFYELTRITNELRPAFLFWENVPGLLSSNDGRDFLAVLVEMDRIGYHGAWRVLDAQYIGVAQRRRRVFGCFTRLDLGAAGCAEVLSLAEGMRWNPPPRREKGKGVAGTLANRAKGGGGLGTDLELDGGLQDASANLLIPEVSPPLLSVGADAGSDGQTYSLIPEVGKPLTTSNQRIDYETETLIPETSDPISANEARTYSHAGNNAGRLNNVVGFSAKDSGGDAGDLSPTLRAGGHVKSHANGGVMPAVSAPSGVRRLTPTECERLQGFPDGWTSGFADGTRYKMLGNAVPVPYSEWIARRIVKLTKRA